MSEEKITYLPETGHWKELFSNKNAHIGAHNINESEEITLTIKWVGKGDAVDSRSGDDISVPMIKFHEAPPMILNVTNGQVIEGLHGSMKADWIGKQIIIYKAMGRSFGGGQDFLVKVKNQKPVQADPTEWVQALEGCTTMEELSKVFISVPKHIKPSVNSVKDAMKAKLESK